MKWSSLLVVTLIALASVGCGHLRVEMAVVEPTYVEEEVCRLDVQLQLPKILAVNTRVVDQSLLDLQNAHFAFYQLLSDEYSKEAEQLQSEVLQSIADELVNGFHASIGVVYVDTRVALQVLDARIRKLANDRNRALDANNDDQAKAVERALCAPLKERRERLLFLQRFAANDTEGQLENWDAVPPAIEQSAKAIVSQGQELPTQRSLIARPEAYAVANAGEKHWADTYNRVLGRGQLGNINVAVKMRKDGNFTIKGVTFDPSDVARVASKAAVQTLTLASQIAGVPVMTQGQGAMDGAALAASSRRLTEAHEDLAATQARLADYERALLTIANAVLREGNHIGGSDAERARAIAAITATFDAHKSRLTVARNTDDGGSS